MSGGIKDPIVLIPESFSIEEAWGQCNKHVEDSGGLTHPDGEVNWGAAFGADPGCCGCPSCHQSFWAWGNVLKCTECDFVFPTDWWPEFSRGVNDGRSGVLEDFHTPIKKKHPYYRVGFDIGRSIEVIPAWDLKANINWKTEVGDCDYVADRMELLRICERCGAVKEPHRQNSTRTCVQCESKCNCRHYQPSKPLDRDGCKLGVNLVELVGDAPGFGTRIPCRIWSMSKDVVPCSKFSPVPVNEVIEDDELMEQTMNRFMLTLPLQSRIKKEHKGTNWSGVEECPVCKGNLHLSHAACNGHVHGKCETDGCLAWME